MGVLIVAGLILYFLPGIIASLRRHRQSVAIGVLNLLLGWTLIGWVVALVWSLMNYSSPALPDSPRRPWWLL